jgi:hypothetical protein
MQKFERWRDFVESLTWQKGSLNGAENEAFIRACGLSVDKQTAVAVVAEKIRLAGDTPKFHKLDREFDSAHYYVNHQLYEGSGWNGAHRDEPKAEYEPKYLEAFVAGFNEVVDDAYLEARSQFTCWNRTPAGFLHKIFKPSESAWVTTNDRSSEGLIWAHEGPIQNLAELNHLATGRFGVWFLSNPIDGRVHAVQRLATEYNPKGLSFRCAECVTDWRHAVLETDEAPNDLWLKALVLLELPIVAIYHSGKRGPHALVNLGAHSPLHWKELVAPHRSHLVRLGACPDTLTPLRLTRLPGCIRGETRRLQQLLYLSPDAETTPIAQRPIREGPLAVWARQAMALRAAATIYPDLKYPPL